MQHSEGFVCLGLRVATCSVRENDDQHGWTGHGEHHEFGRVAFGLRAFKGGRMRYVFGRPTHAWRYQAFIRIPGVGDITGRITAKRPSNTDVYSALSRVLGAALRNRHFPSLALRQAAGEG